MRLSYNSVRTAMALATKTESNVYDENYHDPENLSRGISQTSTSKIADTSALDQSALSAVSWAAILAGATAAAALALILLLLGTGLGLTLVSPWANNGTWANMSATSFGLTAILWLTFTQVVAYGMGGYLAGRLRTRWLSVHSDEVYFRDTAHGFLTWAVASLATAILLTSVIGSIVGAGLKSAPVILGENSTMLNPTSDAMNYFVGGLFRKNTDTQSAVKAAENSPSDAFTAANRNNEVATIFANSVGRGDLPQEDVAYVGQLISERTGLSQIDAQKRVIETYSTLQTNLRKAELTAKEAADKARKASAYATLWLFISLLMGAFVASWAATWGGRNRDA